MIPFFVSCFLMLKLFAILCLEPNWSFLLSGYFLPKQGFFFLCLFLHLLVSWRKKDARDLTFLKLRAWDRSDNRKLGYHQLNASLMDSLSAFSSQAVKCIVSKLGCDNVEGSGLQRDKCGVCAKRLKDRNKCLGCDGKPNSGKKRGNNANLLFSSYKQNLKAVVHPKDTACCIEIFTDGKSEHHPIKMLELFQNNVTSLLGEHGPLTKSEECDPRSFINVTYMQ